MGRQLPILRDRLEPDERTERGPKPKITLPRLKFLEKPPPVWWGEHVPAPAPRRTKGKSA